uniref:variable large family protein n=1 Tax=Borreliella afzelii TaxID=29518 RepID=UPI003AF64321
AKKAGVELKPEAAGGDDNKEAGKLFASGGNNANAGADAGNAQKAAAAAGKAVSAVSGDQILKAIVDAAESNAGGKKADDATNAVEAAIGGDGDGAAEFGDDGDKIGKKNDQIAAAIVLRGLAKGGKFANANDAANDKVQAAVKSAGEWLKEMHTAADATAKAGGGGGSDLIANVAAGGADQAKGAKADTKSVTGIAKGMKGIVDAAKKAGVELKPEAAGGGSNKEAGKLFASGDNAIAGAGAAA